MRWSLKLILYFNLLLAAATLLAYISPYVNPAYTWFFSFFSLGFPILLILNIAFMVFWLMVKPKNIIFSLVILAVGWGAIKRTVGFELHSDSENGLKVLSYNIGHTKYFLDGDEGPKNQKAFKSFLNSTDADVVCIQERTRRHLEVYDALFEGYSLFPKEFIGTGIYSKLPILDSGNIYFDTNAHNATWVEVALSGRRIRIYNIHLSSNKIRQISNKENIKEILDESIFILDKYNLHAVKRTEQMLKILAHAGESPYPVVLAGDFNDVPQSYLYRLISDSYCDAFAAKGFGFGKTHKTRLPILRIDYMFHSEDLRPLSQKCVKVNYSDHYPLLTSFAVN